MSDQFFTADQAILEAKCSRTTFFSHRKKLDIKPIKRGGRAYYTSEQVEAIKNSLNPPEFQTNTDEHGTKTNKQTKQPQTENNEQETNSKQTQTNNAEFLAYLKTELERKNKALEASQESIRTLSEEVGQWRGQAQAFERLNNKLLEERKEAQQIREAKIIPDEPDTPKESPQVVEVETEESPKAEEKPQTFRQKWRAFWNN